MIRVMAGPIPLPKQTVDLAAPRLRVSHIRRDPPPPEKKVTAGEIRDRDTMSLVVGIATLTLALIVVLISLTNAAGWSPSQYIIHIKD